ncbi:class I SAM-dependent methyltransferase [Cohnella hongkongensis]|uniref:Class I SAM-dependent methyltransferase n=1 Tax=Cohnella hongkongensis TaxID=178337 RepID=A0ABV9FH54_9BACL
MENEKAAPGAYPQTGVASTCRSFDEYGAMFKLEPSDWTGPVLDVAGGAASFTASLHAKGVQAVAADPWYGGDADEIAASGFAELKTASDKVARMADQFDWSYYGSPEGQRALRERSLALFAEDFRKADAGTRYVAAALPDLPFADDTFGLVLCSHFLFLYADQFDEDFHLAALRELIRVTRPGGQVRIYPLVTLKWERCFFVEKLVDELRDVAEHAYIPSGLPFIPVRSPLLQLLKKTGRAGGKARD